MTIAEMFEELKRLVDEDEYNADDTVVAMVVEKSDGSGAFAEEIVSLAPEKWGGRTVIVVR